MKSAMLLLTIYVAILCPTRGASAQGYAWQDLTQDDAILVVRAFEGDASLAVTSDGLRVINFSDPAMFAQSAEYELHANGYSYTVVGQVKMHHFWSCENASLRVAIDRVVGSSFRSIEPAV